MDHPGRLQIIADSATGCTISDDAVARHSFDDDGDWNWHRHGNSLDNDLLGSAFLRLVTSIDHRHTQGERCQGDELGGLGEIHDQCRRNAVVL